MPSIFSLSVAALLAAIPATYALDHYITVGKGGNKYDPPFVQAKIGDKVKFQFFPKNHTVTQSPFETPCTAQAYGINSGFQFVPDDYNTKYFEFEVKEEKPLWFYCQQAKHCSEDGMVFAVNPPAYGDKTFDAFQQLAKKQHQDTPAPPKNNDQPWGYQQPPQDDKPWGYQQPPKDDKPWGYQQPPKDDKPWGYQQPPKDDKSWGYQQPPKDDNSWGYQQPPKDDKPWEHQQPPPKYDDKPWEHQQPPSQPTDHYVTVGKGGNKYDPPFVNAKIGDKVKFQFFPKNHTVTQSPFETPCTAQPYGINSGFQFVTDDYNTKWFEFEVKEDQPLWFYCQQAKHCSMDGMVFAVNPPAYGDKTFDAFQQLAKKQNQDAPAPPTYNDKPWEHQQPPKDDKPWEHQQPPKDAKPWEHQQPPKDDKPWQYQQPAMNDSKPWDHQQSPSYPTEHYITVGKGGNKYDPPFISAKIGDKVKFQFFPKNHTVTQSPFETPCTAQDWGINSGLYVLFLHYPFFFLAIFS
ncbi:hypothetical protein DL96DRAFT_917071 [Flagelloscypha sp. PMI_526]|nr:hypothetical protein DL96DRAFT_917071 [Flagelloscypha sp. PMI_526]